MKSRSTTYVALLRGINLGGKNKLPMKDLVGMFAEAGCGEVRNYIQSGNVIFTANQRLAARIPDVIAAQISKRFGYLTPVILRTAQEMIAVMRSNPFLKAAVPEEALHVMFLSNSADPEKVQILDINRSPPDEFIVRDREIYLRLPNGAGRTKLTNAYFDSRLGLFGTQRNWNTVGKILELMGE